MSPLGLRTALRLVPGLILVCGLTAWAADATKKSPPPKFDAATVDELFFKDARQQLIGAPPTAGGQVATSTTPGTTMAPGGSAPAAAASSDGNAWSALVSADTLESEIKVQPAEIDKAMKSPTQQKSARMVMSYLAALYGVVMRYDKDVRWKSDAQALRDTFAKAGNNLKAWTDTQKKQVAKVQVDLRDLIQGNPPQLATAFDAEAPWTELVDRTPLMHRLEIGIAAERLGGWTKDADSVKKNKDAVIREAEVMAMLARIIQDKSYDSTDDEEYLKPARALEEHAIAAAKAARDGDGAAASSAVGQMQKACDTCHGSFR
ncbi:MAG: hypothetical protein C0483_15970 [Pirellula sp.]|nr:hypothetical protein [Pirellula sp.]